MSIFLLSHSAIVVIVNYLVYWISGTPNGRSKVLIRLKSLPTMGNARDLALADVSGLQYRLRHKDLYRPISLWGPLARPSCPSRLGGGGGRSGADRFQSVRVADDAPCE